jgi:serine phosphatase RsbU (regulator of sigma subunit)
VTKLTVCPPFQEPFTHPLPFKQTSIGRAKDSDLPIDDSRTSRHHCAILYANNQFFLEDTQSTHGTYLNRRKVQGRKILRDGDRISIGGTELQFTAEASEVEIDDQLETDPGGELSFHVENLIRDYRPGQSTRGGGVRSLLHPTQDQAIFSLRDFGVELLAHTHLQPILDLTLDFVSRSVPARRGVVMLGNEDGRQLPEMIRTFGDGIRKDPIPISGSIVNAVFESKASLLTRDARLDKRFKASESLLEDDVRSAICSPLWSEKRVVGLIYLDRGIDQEPFTKEDLCLLSSLANMAALKIENARLFEEALEKRALEEQLSLASEIQKGLLPHGYPEIPALDLAAVQMPCFQVGGDYYDFFPLKGGSIGVAIGDVSGKGLGPSLLMATLRAFFCSQLRIGRSLPDLFQDLSTFIHESSSPGTFITFFYGELQPETGSLRFANAGHNAPLIVGKEVKTLPATGLPLGIFPERGYEEGETKLEPEDVLLLFTDGVTERRNESDDEFGEFRLRDVAHGAQEMLHTLEASIKEFGGQAVLQDDMTIVVLKRDVKV